MNGYPQPSIAADANNNLYIVLPSTGTVYKYRASDSYQTAIPLSIIYYEGTDSQMGFFMDRFTYLAVDSNGWVYVLGSEWNENDRGIYAIEPRRHHDGPNARADRQRNVQPAPADRGRRQLQSLCRRFHVKFPGNKLCNGVYQIQFLGDVQHR